MVKATDKNPAYEYNSTGYLIKCAIVIAVVVMAVNFIF